MKRAEQARQYALYSSHWLPACPGRADHSMAKTTEAQRRKMISPKSHGRVEAELGLWRKRPLSPVIEPSVFPPYPTPLCVHVYIYICVHIDTYTRRGFLMDALETI